MNSFTVRARTHIYTHTFLFHQRNPENAKTVSSSLFQRIFCCFSFSNRNFKGDREILFECVCVCFLLLNLSRERTKTTKYFSLFFRFVVCPDFYWAPATCSCFRSLSGLLCAPYVGSAWVRELSSSSLRDNDYSTDRWNQNNNRWVGLVVSLHFLGFSWDRWACFLLVFFVGGKFGNVVAGKNELKIGWIGLGKRTASLSFSNSKMVAACARTLDLSLGHCPARDRSPTNFSLCLSLFALAPCVRIELQKCGRRKTGKEKRQKERGRWRDSNTTTSPDCQIK